MSKSLEEKLRGESMKDYKKGLVLGDPHFPFEDKKIIRVVNKFVKDFTPDYLFVVGDVVDFYEVSKFDKDPKRKSKLQYEIDKGVKWLEYLRSVCPKAKIWFFEGANHEDRLRKYLWKHPELSSLRSLKIESLLGLDRLDIKLVPYDKSFVFRGVYINHGTKALKHSSYTAKAMLEDVFSDGVVGHTHRLGSFYKSTLGKDLEFFENGCMCSLSQGYARNPNWQHGFTILHFGKDFFTPQQVHIKKHRFIYEGRLYK